MTFTDHVESCRECNGFEYCPEGLAILRESLFENVHRAEEAERCEEISQEETNV